MNVPQIYYETKKTQKKLYNELCSVNHLEFTRN